MTKKFLHKKMQMDDNSKLGKEIEQALDLGKSISISPSYLFYYSPDMGCQYIKNSQLIRIYAEVRIRRYGNSYLVFECKEKHRIKIIGHVDFFHLRTALDLFCPQVLIGKEGREMNAEELLHLYQRKRQVLFIVILFLLCWMGMYGVCTRAQAWFGIAVFAVMSIIGIILAILLIRFLSRGQK